MNLSNFPEPLSSHELKLEANKEFSTYFRKGIIWTVLTDFMEDLNAWLLTDNLEETIKKIEHISLDSSSESPQIQIIKDFINEIFPLIFLKKSLISGMILDLDTINLHIQENNFLELPTGDYYIPKEIFLKFWNKFSQDQRFFLSQNIYRAEGFCWYIQWYKKAQWKLFPSPVVIYNQDFDVQNRILKEKGNIDQVGLNYLGKVNEDDREEAYLCGTVGHEIGHHAYSYILSKNPLLFKEWQSIINQYSDITCYASKWSQMRWETDYNENFAEAIRLYTTVADYLKDHFPLIMNFISKNFPEIKAMSYSS